MWPPIEVRADNVCPQPSQPECAPTAKRHSAVSAAIRTLVLWGEYRKVSQITLNCVRLDEGDFEEPCGLEMYWSVGFTLVMLGRVLHYEDPPYADHLTCLVDLVNAPYRCLIPRRTKRVQPLR